MANQKIEATFTSTLLYLLMKNESSNPSFLEAGKRFLASALSSFSKNDDALTKMAGEIIEKESSNSQPESLNKSQPPNTMSEETQNTSKQPEVEKAAAPATPPATENAEKGLPLNELTSDGLVTKIAELVEKTVEAKMAAHFEGFNKKLDTIAQTSQATNNTFDSKMKALAQESEKKLDGIIGGLATNGHLGVAKSLTSQNMGGERSFNLGANAEVEIDKTQNKPYILSVMKELNAKKEIDTDELLNYEAFNRLSQRTAEKVQAAIAKTSVPNN